MKALFAITALVLCTQAVVAAQVPMRVEMEVAGQLLGGGVTAELAVALALLRGEKGDRHQVRPRPASAR